MKLFGISLRGVRDGALIGVLTYSLAYAAYVLHGPLTPHVTNGIAQSILDRTHSLVAGLGMAGVGYFALAGAAVGAIPFGSIFGKPDEPKRKKA